MILGSFNAQLGQAALGSVSSGLVATATDSALTSESFDVRVVPPNTTPPFPQVRVFIAFEEDPSLIEPDYTEVTAYLQSVSIRQGRSRELDRFETGTAVIQLRNPDRRFEPEYDGSPYYPWIVPMRRVRIVADHNGTEYPLFAGFIENWGLSWQLYEGTVSITCADAFKVFANYTVSASYPVERSDERMHRILDDVGYTRQWWSLNHNTLSILGETTILGGAGDDARVISVGAADLQASTLTNTPALTHMQTVTQTEGGRFWVRGDGVVIFLDRTRVDVALSYKTIFGDYGISEYPYDSIGLQFGESEVFNVVSITRNGGLPQLVEDEDSQFQYLKRSLAKQGLLFSDDYQSLGLATWLLARYKDPHVRFTSISLRGQSAWGLWNHVLNLTIGDQILVRRRPLPNTDPIEKLVVIEGVSHEISGAGSVQSWSTAWQLSETFSDINHWRLEDPGFSELGTTTILPF